MLFFPLDTTMTPLDKGDFQQHIPLCDLTCRHDDILDLFDGKIVKSSATVYHIEVKQDSPLIPPPPLVCAKFQGNLIAD